VVIYVCLNPINHVQLRKLQLIGFKTFAEKTEIEIGDGLTAVVGPNGSGKSNIADAILWVMGEQNPRLLRGNDSRDVIFSGTDNRKPLGMAEVRLTLDNSDFSLPIDFAEVSVTRRIYRSGESQYLLNNAPCRMKDIVELFLDTGVGKGAYSFVSQSEIDAVLSARAEDRRELFEEAAGIKKYRVKKREAVRKLEQAGVNLNRVRDIIHELETQREPLEQQAVKARKFRELTNRLQAIEVDLLVAEVQKTDYEIYAARQEQELDHDAISRYDADLARMEHESSDIGERLAQAEQDADSARVSHQSALTTVERTESQLMLVQERGSTAEQSAEALEIEIRDLSLRASSLTRELARYESELDKAAKHESKRREELAAAAARLDELESALTDARRDSDFYIIARTDALAVEGVEGAVGRARRYHEAGADMVFVDAPVGREQTEAVARGLKGIPLLANIAASGKTPDIPAEELGRLGFKLALYANYAILAAIPAVKHVLGELKRTGTIAHLRGQMATFKYLNEIVGLPEIQELENRYGVPEEERTTL